MGRAFQKIPIVDTARRCALVLDSRTLRHREVEASCPFCGDRGPGKHHLYLNTDKENTGLPKHRTAAPPSGGAA